MTNASRAAPGDIKGRGKRRAARAYTGRGAEPTEDDPLFVRALGFLQEAQWPEAQAALMALEQRYPGSKGLAELRQLLTLRLSAEETWASTGRYRLSTALGRPAVRGLMIANLVVYALLGLVWLFGEISGLAG